MFYPSIRDLSFRIQKILEILNFWTDGFRHVWTAGRPYGCNFQALVFQIKEDAKKLAFLQEGLIWSTLFGNDGGTYMQLHTGILQIWETVDHKRSL